jgi:hypothetical protein
VPEFRRIKPKVKVRVLEWNKQHRQVKLPILAWLFITCVICAGYLTSISLVSGSLKYELLMHVLKSSDNIYKAVISKCNWTDIQNTC